MTESKNLININMVKNQTQDPSQDTLNLSSSKDEAVQEEVAQAKDDMTVFRFVGRLYSFV